MENLIAAAKLRLMQNLVSTKRPFVWSILFEYPSITGKLSWFMKVNRRVQIL
ncbi:hypothetical protein [Halpernia sp. GG3]